MAAIIYPAARELTLIIELSYPAAGEGVRSNSVVSLAAGELNVNFVVISPVPEN